MPRNSRQLVIGGLSVSQVQNFLPRSWKHCVESAKGAISVDDDFMTSTPLTFLKVSAKQGCLSDAFKWFSQVKIRASYYASYDHNVQSISSLLSCCINLKYLPAGKQLHAQIISLGLEQNSALVPQIVTFYSAFGFFSDAHAVVESSNIVDTLPWNLLISSYVKNGRYREALNAYRQLVKKGIEADSYTYPSVLKACGEESDLVLGKQIHEIIESGSQDWCLFVHNALVAMYGKVGEIDVSRRLFDEMPERDMVSWNTIISVYASKDMWKEAFEMFDKMGMEGVEVSIITWNTIAGGYLRTCNFEGALKFLNKMMKCGLRLDSVAMIIGLTASSHIGAIRSGKEIHAASIRSYYDGLDNVRNALITMYSRCNDLRHASILFCQREVKNVVTWNAIISGYANMGKSEEASLLFREMLYSGFEPNYVTFASILPLCARVANLQHGKEIHCYITKREGFKEYLLLWNALVDMYAKSGKLLAAKRMFDYMTRRDEVTYTSLISGYGIQGDGHTALALFEEMIGCGIKPDHVTMVAILSACSHSGLVTEGQLLFDKMVTIYGISPRLEHYDCLVDLYGRACLLNKAKDVIMRMPYEPSADIWATLLGACRIHGNTIIGEWAAEKLLEMRPQNSGYYVLIANIYAAAGRWEKLAQVRSFMRELGVRKDPGCAWVDVGSGFSSFMVEDTSNPCSKEIYPVLEGLTELMKDVCHASAEDLDTDHEVIEGELVAIGR